LVDWGAINGRSAIGTHQLHTALRKDEPAPAAADEPPVARKSRAQPTGILVVGVDKLFTVLAKCRKPAPPDLIIGFVLRGRGVTLHRKGCANVARLDTERLAAADWGMAPDTTFSVDIVIEANVHTGLLRDITEILSRERINVTATNTVSRGAAALFR
jgi:GTP pyrophosphokinase